MNADRAEWTGVGAALVFHAALIAALSMSLATIRRPPEQPSMEVELVDDVALQSAAPTPVPPAPAPAANAAPEPTPPLPQQPPLPQAVAPPTATPHPQPAATQRLQPPRPAAPPSRPAPRPSQLGDDFLKSLDGPQPVKASAAASHFDARAKASVASLFQRRVQPCANQQINPGEGANRIRVTVNLRLRPNGTLAGTPQIVRVTGVDDDNARYEERVKDLAVAVYRECSPFSGLPPELYKTPEGGWSNINLTYKLP